MYLKNISMIAADTSRSFIYIKELIRNDLLPNYIFLLENKDRELLPGQKETRSINVLTEILLKNNIKFEIAQSNDINNKDFINGLKKRKEQNVIYSGFGGTILKDDILSSGKNFLHVHGGFLPEFKGSTTNYFSLIKEKTVGASSIFLTKDIDAGPIIYRKKFPAPLDRREIDHSYDSEVRAKVLIKTLKDYKKKGIFNFIEEKNTGGEIYFIIHPVLKHIAILGD